MPRRAAVDRVREDPERALAPRLGGRAPRRRGRQLLPGLYALYERLGSAPLPAHLRGSAPFAARNVWFAGDGGGALAPRLAAFLDARPRGGDRVRRAAVGRRDRRRRSRRARARVRAARAVARRGAARRGGDEPRRLRARRRRPQALRRGPGAGAWAPDAGGALVLDAGHALVDAFAASRRRRAAAPGAQTTTLYGALPRALALARAAAADAAACRDAGADTDSDAAAFRATVAAARGCAGGRRRRGCRAAALARR